MKRAYIAKTTKAIIATAFVAFLFLSLACKTAVRHRTIKGMQLVVSFPYVRSDNGVLTNLRDTVRILYTDRYVLYALPLTRVFETNEQIESSAQYFLCKDTDTTGRLFISPTDSIGRTVSKDSLLIKRAFGPPHLTAPVDSFWTAVPAVQGKHRTFYKAYLPKKTYGENTPDSIIYYYSPQLEKLPVSFSKVLDSTNHATLYKSRIVFNAKKTSNGLAIPNRELRFELQSYEPSTVHTAVFNRLIRAVEK